MAEPFLDAGSLPRVDDDDRFMDEALAEARAALLVFGAPDERAGAVRSAAEVLDATWANHRPRWRLGARRAEAERLLQEFFAGHREPG